MRLRQDIEISYEIRSADHIKRRGGVFSPRKSGGVGNRNQSYHPAIVSASPRQQPTQPQPLPQPNIDFKFTKTNQSSSPQVFEKKKPSSNHRPISAPIQRPKSAELPQRVRQPVVKPPDHAPWDNSTYNVDREHLLVIQDNEVSKFRDRIAWSASPPEILKIGPTHEENRKTISTSYSRCRDPRTSGPILNVESHHVGFKQKTIQRIHAHTATGIHENQWNVSTKDRDEEPRAKPELSSDSKSSDRFHEVFYSSEVRKELTSRGVIVPTQSAALSSSSQISPPSASSPRGASSSGQRRELTWDDIQKVPQATQRSMIPQISRLQKPSQPQPQQHQQRRRG
jgi:hypothetical protein